MSDISVEISFQSDLEDISLLSAPVEVMVQEKLTRKQRFDANLKANAESYAEYLAKQRIRNKQQRLKAKSSKSPAKDARFWEAKCDVLTSKLNAAKKEIKRLREKIRYHAKKEAERRWEVGDLLRQLKKNREKVSKANTPGWSFIHAIKNQELAKKVRDFYHLEENTATVPDKRGKHSITR